MLAGVALAERPSPRRHVGRPAIAQAEIPKIDQQPHGAVVILRQLRRDERLVIAPGFRLARSQPIPAFRSPHSSWLTKRVAVMTARVETARSSAI